jgi:hypothetical protein
MRRTRTLLFASASAGLLAGCEPATAPRPVSQPAPEALFGMAARGLEPEELQLLMKAATDGRRSSQAPAAARPAADRHPLDGLSAADVRRLFAAAGLSPEPYLPAGHAALQADTTP